MQDRVTVANPATWLQCTVPHPGARGVLVCFPHAGGSASFYRDWGRHLPHEVHAARYPGRGERIDEAPPTDLRCLARELADAVRALADRPVALFGHSMGAAVALETARFLEADGVQPAHVFASGSRNGPCPVLDPLEVGDGDDDAALVEELQRLGGTDPALADDPAFRELVLPYVRSDVRMFHTYAHRSRPALHCPVTAIVGDVDSDADCRPWSDLTPAFDQRVVSGDHFYLLAAPPFALLVDALHAATSNGGSGHDDR